jgi:hypothetical protein
VARSRRKRGLESRSLCEESTGPIPVLSQACFSATVVWASPNARQMPRVLMPKLSSCNTGSLNSRGCVLRLLPARDCFGPFASSPHRLLLERRTARRIGEGGVKGSQFSSRELKWRAQQQQARPRDEYVACDGVWPTACADSRPIAVRFTAKVCRHLVASLHPGSLLCHFASGDGNPFAEMQTLSDPRREG